MTRRTIPAELAAAVRRFYNLVFPLVFVLILPGYLRRMVRRGHYRRHFWQRFGFYSPAVRLRLAALTSPVWLQAVSVGEMLVALKLVAALRDHSPGLPLVLSTTTTTGHALAAERAPSSVVVLYTPIDLRGAVRRAFAAIRPAQLVVVDGGLWPNGLWTAQDHRVPTALVNARLSPRSERRFRSFRRLAPPLFGALDLVCVPEENDRSRWQSLGVPPDQIEHTGSIKFDDAPPAPAVLNASPNAPGADQAERAEVLATLSGSLDALVLLAGSTHPGEEKLLAEQYLRLRTHFPDLFLVVAPRHVERTPQIRAELETLGLRVALRTSPLDASAPRPDVLLLDTTGELRAFYELATLAFVGKSLCAVGGQNPAEGIAAGAPVIFGPHMENFEEITTQLLAAQAVVQSRDAANLEMVCARLLADAPERQRMVEAGRRCLEVHRGAARRTAERLAVQRRDFTCQKL